MPKNITIKVSDDLAHWARKQAAEKNTSISQLVSQMLEEQRRATDEYWKAFEDWKTQGPVPGFDASKRWSREKAHERR